MSFWDLELSLFGGKPVELYEFTDGITTWRYTSQARAIEIGDDVYAPAAITRGDIKESAESIRANLSLEFPCTHEFAGQLIGYPSEEDIHVTIRRGHLTDPDSEWAVIWKGAVLMAKGGGQRIVVECATGAAAGRRAGLRRRYSKGCTYALYGTQCGVNKADFAVPGTVAAISGNIVTVTAAEGYADGWFLGGIAEDAAGYKRMIAGHTGGEVTLLWPFRDLAVSDDITLYPGCDRTDATCDVKFDNLLGAGSFRFLPDSNPVGGGSIV